MNKVVLVGRLTKDPELKFLANTGKAVTQFTLAVNRAFKKDEADFINCTAFGKTGELIAQYVTKGRQLSVSGSIRTESYEKDGIKRYTTKVIVDQMEFIGNSTISNVNNNTDFTPSDMTVDDGDIPF